MPNLLSNVALGYLKRQQEETDREREENVAKNKDFLTKSGMFWQKALEGAREEPEVQRALLGRLSEIMSADPYKLKDKDRARLGDVSVLWQGVKLPEEKLQPQQQTQRVQLPGQRGLPGPELAADIPLPAPPTPYRSVYPSREEREGQEYATAQVKAQQDLQNQLARYRGQKQVDLEFSPPYHEQIGAFGGDGLYNQVTGEVLRAPTPKSSDKALQRVKGVLKSKPDETILASYNPENGRIYDSAGNDISKDFQVQDETSGEPLYAVVEGDRVVYRPRSQAAGASAPRTLYDPSGMPSVGGRTGISTTAPPSIPETTQTNLSGWKLAMKLIDTDIMPNLEKVRSTLGPLAGRVRLLEVERLGGLGATPEQIAMAVDLRRLLMSQAFAEGGKQLTPTEKVEFIALNPALTDTLEQAIIKARKSRQYLQDKYNLRLEVMPANQRRLLDMAPPIPTPGAGGTGSMRIEQRNRNTGQYRHSLDGGKTWNIGRLPR